MLLNHFVADDDLDEEEAASAAGAVAINIPGATGNSNKKKCCSISIIPLRVCKLMTIYKIQGITIGEDKVWKRVVVCLPTGR